MNNKTRQIIQERYSYNAVGYDDNRLRDPHGRLLSELNICLLKKMLPACNETLKVVELGAGTGQFTTIALRNGFSSVATDINENMLTELRKKVDDLGFSDRCWIQTEDIFNLSFADSSFDFAFSIHLIPRFLTLEDQRVAIKEVARILKACGMFLFNYRNSQSLYGRLYKEYAATPHQIEHILDEVGMRIVQMKGKRFTTRKLINIMPIFVGRWISALDLKLCNYRPKHCWDVFVMAIKD